MAPEEEDDTAASGTKRKALWDLLGEPAAKEAKVDDAAEEAAEEEEA